MLESISCCMTCMICLSCLFIVPSAPRNLQQTAVDNTSIALNWDQPSESNGIILKYTVRWENSSASSEEHTASNETDYVVKNLVPFTWYTIFVSAVTEAGQGNESKEISVRTSIGSKYSSEFILA